MEEITFEINRKSMMWMVLVVIISLIVILIATDYIYDNFDLVIQSPVLIEQRF